MQIRKKGKRISEHDNRLNLIMAIIFLLVGSVLFKLYSLQVIKYDLYVALASDQHQVYNKLEPIRGRIFIQNNKDDEAESLYPIATNKEFALIYAIPKDIKNEKEVAETFYEIFDKVDLEKEINELLMEDEYFKQLEDETLSKEEWDKINEFFQVKKELEMKKKKDEIVNSYLEKLTKKDDPYEPLQKKVSEENLRLIQDKEFAGIHHIMEIHRYYPENNKGSHMLGFVGYKNGEKRGLYGLEGFFNEELTGTFGSVKTERSANGSLIIINDREYNKPIDGSNLVLTINRSLQFEACRLLNESADGLEAEGGSIIVMEPSTGKILVMCSWPDYDPNHYNEVEDIANFNNPAIFDQYEPGSIFKTITMAASIDQGKVTPNTLFYDRGFVNIEGWPKPIKNSDYETKGGHGMVDMNVVLEKSLNTGIIFAMKKIGPDSFAQYVEKFGFGEKTGIELETEGAGDIRRLLVDNIRPVEAATAAFGQGITVTPLQMISAYAAIANGGMLMKPYLVHKIVSPDGETLVTQPKQIRRVISERTALLVSAMLANVVEGGHAKRAAVDGYYVAGKTGTAQVADSVRKGYGDKTIHTFVGFAPVDDPKFVMLVKLDNPKGLEFAASTAAPLFGRLADFILNYYQVPKDR